MFCFMVCKALRLAGLLLERFLCDYVFSDLSSDEGALCCYFPAPVSVHSRCCYACSTIGSIPIVEKSQRYGMHSYFAMEGTWALRAICAVVVGRIQS